MNLETKHTCDTECHIKDIKRICEKLDFLTSENIETEGGCSLDCCILDDMAHMITMLIESNLTKHLIGEIGLVFLHQLAQDVDWILDSSYEEDFSKTQRWLAFVDYARKGNDHLKQSVKYYTATNAQ